MDIQFELVFGSLFVIESSTYHVLILRLQQLLFQTGYLFPRFAVCFNLFLPLLTHHLFVEVKNLLDLIQVLQLHPYYQSV